MSTGPRRAVADPQPPRLWKPVLALALAVLLGLSGYTSWAYWQDTAEVRTGSFTAGQLDLQLDSGQAVGLGTGYTKTSIAADDLLPAETLAYPLTVRNVSGAAATYGATVQRGSTWTYDGSSITFRLFAGSPDTSDTSYPRQQTCSGSPLGAQTFVPASATSVINVPRALAPGGSETLCVLVGLDSASANANQGARGTLTLVLTSTQAVG
ncbi:SipW-dependent-type signal peptide-containing protein [Desertihabitans aurantiacus]|uniref:SipW-dependent-type signal peptide-containing protein n=1 Tax=Desertihabitans aurantiacus TaxID=2282477 RepID=UPI0013005271|nr:SipW-dependent-type signal peptide-containing protein [Desertihabitans aurantiacus]